MAQLIPTACVYKQRFTVLFHWSGSILRRLKRFATLSVNSLQTLLMMMMMMMMTLTLFHLLCCSGLITLQATLRNYSVSKKTRHSTRVDNFAKIDIQNFSHCQAEHKICYKMIITYPISHLKDVAALRCLVKSSCFKNRIHSTIQY